MAALVTYTVPGKWVLICAVKSVRVTSSTGAVSA